MAVFAKIFKIIATDRNEYEIVEPVLTVKVGLVWNCGPVNWESKT